MSVQEETEMKTLESIREEIWEEMLRLEDKRKDQWADIKYQTLREVLQKLGHLDEPEVLSQELPAIPEFVAEAIEKDKEHGYDVYDSIDLIIETNGGGLPSISDWVARNIDKYARAWLNGYTVEKEEKYYV